MVYLGNRDHSVLCPSWQLRRTTQKCGREELPHTQGQERQPRRATPLPRPGAAAERSNPTSKERWLHGHRKAERSYSMFKVRRDGREEILLIPGKEQRLHFPGADIIVNKRVQNAVLGCNVKNDRIISVCFQGKSFNITVIQVPRPVTLKKLK